MNQLIHLETQEKLFSLMLSVQDAYSEDTRLFVDFLQTNNLGVSFESIQAYAQYLDSEINGKRFAASTYNKRLLGAKHRLCYLFRLFPES